jgi:bifunctional non-homologous end joining protein LigD
MITLIRTASLFFREGTSDKVYHVRIIMDESGTFIVEAQWGRRGSTLQSATKAMGISRAEADRVFGAVVREKRTKGYRMMGSELEVPISAMVPTSSKRAKRPVAPKESVEAVLGALTAVGRRKIS